MISSDRVVINDYEKVLTSTSSSIKYRALELVDFQPRDPRGQCVGLS